MKLSFLKEAIKFLKGDNYFPCYWILGFICVISLNVTQGILMIMLGVLMNIWLIIKK